jgi:hypothetical protein
MSRTAIAVLFGGFLLSIFRDEIMIFPVQLFLIERG